MNIKERIANRRKELNLTLEDIGKAVGVSKSTVGKRESGYIELLLSLMLSVRRVFIAFYGSVRK